MKASSNSASFVLNSAHRSFAEKQKNLFDQLDNAEKSNKRSIPTEEFMDATPADNAKPQRSYTKHYKRKESIFKRPEAPISRCLPVGRMPNFSKQPKKWTKYSLADVSDDDISDRGNTKAALSFLKELEDRRGGDGGDEKVDELPEKIVFKKAAIIHKKEESDEPEEDKASFRSSKLVMPEYVVGQKVKKERRNKEIKMKGAASQLKLDHLLEEEDGED